MKTIIDYANLIKEKHALNETIAPVESDLTAASKAYAIGDQFINDGVLYNATAPIAQNDAIVVGTNCSASDDITTQLAGKEDTLTFDATPTEDSTNPVTSGGVYTKLDELSSEINTLTQQINENGVKNIMPYPFATKEGISQYGVTSVDNLNGIVGVSGTNTSSTANLIMFRWFTEDEFLQNYVGKELTISFEGLTTPESTAYAPLIFYDSNGTEISRITLSSSKTHENFTVTSEMKSASLRFHVMPSKTVNVTLKAMICLKSVYDLDSTWEAPAFSNPVLTQKTTALTDIVSCPIDTDGTYTLQAVVSSGAVTYSWVASS